VWPAYFADWDSAPPMPPISLSIAAYEGTYESLKEQFPALEASLPSITMPVGILMGGRSPMPTEEAGRQSAAVIPGAWVEVADGAGHFPWVERPGCVRSALDRLANG
jgi:proline iminopeptidase